MTVLYSTTATATAGRNGHVATEDGILKLDLSYPKEMGGSGEATNPEQLFAAGYSSCFSNAILLVAKQTKVKLTAAPVSATVDIGPNATGGFILTTSLDVTLDLPQDQAQQIVDMAHQVCPYSNAVMGNIDVEINVKGQVL